eukprot:2993816-Prymnesium_polylepis.1
MHADVNAFGGWAPGRRTAAHWMAEHGQCPPHTWGYILEVPARAHTPHARAAHRRSICAPPFGPLAKAHTRSPDFPFFYAGPSAAHARRDMPCRRRVPAAT